jgi:hypothetical protein
MRKFLLALSLLVGAATSANLVFAGDWENFPNGREPLYHGSHGSIQKYSSTLGSSFGYGDSTYIGYTPGFVGKDFTGAASPNNPWGITASTTTSATNNVHRPPRPGCMWQWDNSSSFGETGANGFPNGDSLQGWWPIRLEWRYLLDTAEPDYNIPANGIDFGNLTNYYPVHGRTTGVVGVWHRDQGGDPSGIGTANNGAASNGVTWRSLAGNFSAWCGLRNHGDATAPADGITGNQFTADVAEWNVHVRYSGAVSVPKFPGYIDQWDQMLYRDIDMSAHTDNGLNLGFLYTTRMSTTADLCGWFDKDPLSPTSSLAGINCATGNYISNWDLSGAGPVDSFMVYVGQPTEGTFQQFNGCGDAVGRAAIYDPLRRWFDEVVEANDPGKVIELLSVAGNDSTHVTGGVGPAAISLTNTQLSPILTASGGKVRLVFRVKTNSRASDVTVGSYNSRGRGAAQVDNVTYTMTPSAVGQPAGWGDFEAANSIDNTQNALNAWRSTGKPPSLQTHLAQLNDGNDPYTDLCGADPTQVGRVCSMAGGIITFGRSSDGRIGSDIPFQSDRESSNGIMSPTIQLRSNNGSWPNTIGIKAPGNPGDGIASNDAMVDYEVYSEMTTDGAPPVATGITYRWLFQCYPQMTAPNPTTNAGAGTNPPPVPQWGNLIRSFANYQTDKICFRSLPGITGQEGSGSALGMYKYSTSSAENPNYPDSIKIGWNCESTCWATGVDFCAPVGGVYIDNVSFVLVDGSPLPLSAEIWNWWQTAFPWNETVTPAFAASFDTAAILVKSGLDIGPADGLNSFDVPGDSIVVASSGTAPMRIDMVFRILPGPGNYRIVGNSGSGLTPNPSAGTPTTGVGRAAVVSNVSSSNLFESFLANNGPFGTAGGHGGTWNPNVWNSARCDTTEAQIFPRSVGAPTASSWQSTYHDIELGIGAADAYSATTVVRSGIGVPRHKCFLASNTAEVTDIDCQHDPPSSGAGYDLSWVTATGSGYNGVATTTEGTRIIPDGLLTPGAHVEYFWRKAEGGSTAMTGMLPDTSIVVPQLGERNNDGHRFAGFGALPDRWKNIGYTHPLGLTPGNPACMLVVNDQTTNGYDWLAWSGTADTIGATGAAKRGAEVGWANAPGNGADVNNAAYRVAAHLGNPGTTWDGYQIIGAEDTAPAGSFGARYAHSDNSNTQINGKRQQGAPTLEQLKAFYKVVLWFAGNLNAFTMGPSGDRGSDDTQLIKDYLLSGSPVSANRAFFAVGDGFVEGNEKEDPLTGQHDLDLNYLGVELQNGQYRVESSNAATTITLVPKTGGPIADGTVYGVRNTCTHSNDVLKVGVGAVQSFTSILTEYADPNPSDAITYPANILKSFNSSKPWIALTEGWTIMDLMSRFGSDTRGRSKFFFKVFASVFGGVCPINGTPVVPLDVPNLSEGNMLADFVALRNNPLSSGMARIHFGLSRDDRVQIKVYDVTGREIKLLADRAFKAGEHDIVWDGSDNGGRPVARGVYFAQVRYKDNGFMDAKKVTVLK